MLLIQVKTTTFLLLILHLSHSLIFFISSTQNSHRYFKKDPHFFLIAMNEFSYLIFHVLLLNASLFNS